MKRPVSIAMLFVCFLLLVFTACSKKTNGSDDTLSNPSTQKQKIIRLSVTTDPYIHLGSSVTFTFSMPMINAGDITTTGIEPAQVAVSMTPHINGHYSWLSPYILEFVPEINAMQWGQSITVSITKAVPLKGETQALQTPWTKRIRIKYLEIAGKVASWAVVPGYPRFIQALTSYTEEVGAGPVLLLYDQKVDPSRIIPHIRVAAKNGRKLSFTVSTPENLDYLFDGNSVPEEIQGLIITDLPEDGESITIDVPQWIHPETIQAGEEPGMTIVRCNLKVNTQFEMVRLETSSRRTGILPLKSKIYMRFNNKYNFYQIQNMMTISPKPISFYMYQDWDGSIAVSTELKPGTDYKLYLEGTPRDVLGNPLAPFEFSFRSQDLPPILKAPQYPIVLEKGKNSFRAKVRNTGTMEARVYTIEKPEDFARALGHTDFKKIEEYGVSGTYSSFPVDTSHLVANEITTIDVTIDNSPGLKCVEIRGDGMGSEASGIISDTVLVQNTNIGITSKVLDHKILVWTTTLDTAAILRGIEINLVSDYGVSLARGMTDDTGVALFDNVDGASATGLNEPLVVIAHKSYETAVSRLVNDELSYPWQFGLPGVVKNSGVLRASMFTERGIYRPGETVNIKTILSLDTADKGDKVNIKIKDPKGKRIVDTNLTLDLFGAADYELPLGNNAPVGEYMIQLEKEYMSTGHTFRVEEYRVPTFIVSLSTDTEVWNPGESKNVLIDAEYSHGGKLGGRTVKWNVFRQYEAFSSPLFPGYQFALETPSTLNSYIARDETKLNGQGQLPITFSLNSLAASGASRYIIEAAVTDVDRQTYAGRLSKIVHSSDFYLGVLPPPRAVVIEGESIQVPVVAVLPGGTITEGVKVTAYLERIDYHTTPQLSESGKVQLFNREVPEEVERKHLVTGQAGTLCSFTLNKAGYYRVRLTAVDSQKRDVETGFIITATGDNQTAWPRFDKDQIELIIDKDHYEPGETARIVAQLPYKKATGLLTVERDSILYYKSFDINDNTPMIPLYIEGSYAPNVFVSCAIVRGRIHDKTDATDFETGAPGFKIGYKKIRVTLKEKRLTVLAQPQEHFAQPGDTIGINITLADYLGKPASGQVTLMVVDEAVLSLTNFKLPDPLPGLYRDYPLGVRTGTLYFDLPHSRRSRREIMFPGGGFGDDTMMSLGFPISLRKLFKSTVYWNPDIRIGENGKESIHVTLPDNTTTYRIMAVACDTLRRAGSGEDKVVSQKPLMIQPAIPRFIYPGDQFQAEVLVFNASPAAGDITVQAQFKGLTLVSGSDKQTKSARPGESVSFSFKVKAPGDTQPILEFAAQMNNNTDAARFTLPLLEPGTKQVVVKNTTVIGSRTLSVDMPKDRVEGSVNLELVASSTALSELKDSVQYLMHYPNGCIEQTTSSAYPLVVLGDLLPDIGVEVDMAALKDFAEAGVKRILSFQTSQGGLSYWPGGTEPHAFATAFGLTALIEAKQKGYDVPDDALAGMANFLEAELRKGVITGEMPHGGMADGDTRALIVMTLGRLGRPQSSYISTLWREKDQLTGFGLSFLAIAVKEMGGEMALLEDILAEIRRIAEEKSDEAYFDKKPK
ncbi:MAG: hypothetical protein JXJ04_10600, partial [Spirochaetales bacterium]|nr:hypothetical protein [Spirochaetales bacterium]